MASEFGENLHRIGCGAILLGLLLISSVYLISMPSSKRTATASIESIVSTTVPTVVPPDPVPADFYVATDGNDLWSGRLPSPNSNENDGPFASVTRLVPTMARAR